MAETLLSLSHLSLAIDQKTLFSDIHFDIGPAQFIGIIGASGSGKTLLFKTIMGLLPPSPKFVMTGRIISTLKTGDICYVPQSLEALNPLLKLDKLFQRAIKLRTGSCWSQKQLRQHLESFSLSPVILSYYPHQLSGGMAKRVLLALASLKRPRLLLVDEPTAGLDHALADDILKHLSAFKTQGTAILLITHDVSQLERLADDLLIFYQGKIIEKIDTHSYFNDPQLIKHSYSQALLDALPKNIFIQGKWSFDYA